MKDFLHKIFRTLLGLLGFACVFACDGKDNVENSDDLPLPEPEYGPPFVTFRLQGVVVDEDDESPVKGVKAVSALYYTYEENGKQKVELHEREEAEVDDDGNFLIRGDGFECPNAVLLKDLDESEDGHYKDTLHIVEPVLLEDYAHGAEGLVLKMKSVSEDNTIEE